MTASSAGTAEVIELRTPHVNRIGARDLYEVGEIPPLGHVPRNMYAWAIRKERQGEPISAMQQEVVPTHEIADDECLVMVMAAGVNYNGVWAALGKPVSMFDVHKQPYHIAGSDASGIVWAVGSKVKRWKVGDEVVIHCNQDDGDDEECNGGEPDVLAQPAHLGLRDPGRLLRPVLPRPVPPAHAPAQAPHLGGGRLLRPDAGHRLPDAVRPQPAPPQARRERAGLGCRRRAGLDGDPDHRRLGRQRRGRDLRGGEARVRDVPGCEGGHQPQGLQLLGRDAGPDGPGGLRQVGLGGAQVRQGDLGVHRQGQRRRPRLRASRRLDLPGLGPGLQARRHGGDLCRHHRLQAHGRRPLLVDAAEAPPGQPLRQPQAGLVRPTASSSTARSTPA